MAFVTAVLREGFSDLEWGTDTSEPGQAAAQRARTTPGFQREPDAPVEVASLFASELARINELAFGTFAIDEGTLTYDPRPRFHELSARLSDLDPSSVETYDNSINVTLYCRPAPDGGMTDCASYLKGGTRLPAPAIGVYATSAGAAAQLAEALRTLISDFTSR